MYKLNPECWIQSPGLSMSLCPYDSGRTASDVLNHEEEEKEERAGQMLFTCDHTTGCDDIIGQSDSAQWFTYEPPVHLEIPTTSGLTGCDCLLQHRITEITADHVGISQHFIEGCCCEDAMVELNGYVGGFGQRGQEDLDPCWAESPCIYYGVRRNMVVGVEVVEEVAVEDTLEVILEDVHADGLLDFEVLPAEHLYPT